MDVEFRDSDLDRLEVDPDFAGGYDQRAVRGFRKVMQILRAAVDERDLYAMKSLRFEKLSGDRSGQRSLRLNDQWRLIVEIVPATPKNTVAILEIVDYH